MDELIYIIIILYNKSRIKVKEAEAGTRDSQHCVSRTEGEGKRSQNQNPKGKEGAKGKKQLFA
jgi:hypothetical protein